MPELTPLAALGLVPVMLGAAVWHAGREEFLNIGQNLLLAGVLAYLGYARWKLHPLAHRHEGSSQEGTAGPISA